MKPTEFYVALFSTSSKKYTDDGNTTSEFTNFLAKPIDLSGGETWSVALTEIAYNAFTALTPSSLSSSSSSSARPTRSLKRTASEIFFHDYDEGDGEIGRSKRTKSSTTPLVIKLPDLGELYEIEITPDDFKAMSYNKAKMDINCGTFLRKLNRFLKNAVGSKDFVVDEDEKARVLQNIKLLIYNELKILDMDDLTYYTVAPKSGEPVIHIYMGSRTSDNVTLNYRKYDSLQSFVRFIIHQLPPKSRNLKKILELFDLFESDYKIDKSKDVIHKVTSYSTPPYPSFVTTTKPDDDVVTGLHVKFEEYGVEIYIPEETLKTTSAELTFTGLFELLKNNLRLIDDPGSLIPDGEKKDYLDKVFLAIEEALSDGSYDERPHTSADPPSPGSTIAVHVPTLDPVKGFVYVKTTLEVKSYERIENFLNKILDQVVPELRNRDFLVKELKVVFEKTPSSAMLKINLNDGHNSSVSIGSEKIRSAVDDAETIDYAELIELLMNNIETTTGGDVARLRERVKNIILLKIGSDLDFLSHTVKTRKESTDRIVRIPYTTDDGVSGNSPVILEVKTYDSLEDFLNELLSQLPIHLRTTDELMKVLDEKYEKIDLTKLSYMLMKDDLATIKTSLLHTIEPVVTSSSAFPSASESKKLIEDTLRFKRDPASDRNLSYFYVYTDIIHTTFVGDILTKCLRVVPVTDNGSNRIEFKNPEYHTVERDHISKISILITGVGGDAVKFEDVMPTYILLHFKREREREREMKMLYKGVVS